MKKIGFYISIFVLMVTALQSCKVEDNYGRKKNQKGMEVTSYWIESTKLVLLTGSDRGFIFNAWLSATGEDQQQIEDTYFSYYTIRQESENVWVMSHGNDIRWRIRTDGRLLSETGAEWTVVDYQPQNIAYIDLVHNYADSVVSVVKSLGNMSWDIRIMMENVMSEEELYAHFTVTSLDGSVPLSLLKPTIMISGDGCYGFRTYTYSDGGENPDEILNYIRFALSDGTLSGNHSTYPYDIPGVWTGGLLQLVVYADTNAHDVGYPLEYYDEMKITAGLSVHDGNQYADITMYGVTESWQVVFPMDNPTGCVFFIPFW